MKEASGEGSMTVITIIVIAALAVGATILVGFYLGKVKSNGTSIGNQEVKSQQNLDGVVPSGN